jgi:hypothetical protein
MIVPSFYQFSKLRGTASCVNPKVALFNWRNESLLIDTSMSAGIVGPLKGPVGAAVSMYAYLSWGPVPIETARLAGRPGLEENVIMISSGQSNNLEFRTI